MQTATSPDVTSPPDQHAAAVEVCDVFRDSRFNMRYYGRKLAILQQWNTGIEIAIALGTSGTALAVFKRGDWGVEVAYWLAGVAAILGVLKPILNLPKRIERASKLWSGYAAAFVAAQRIVRNLKVRRSLDGEDARAALELHSNMDALFAQDDPHPSERLLKKLQSQVNAEFPPETLWCPPESGRA